MRTLIKHLLAAAEPLETVTVQGWIRTRRDAKGFSFLELNDGSCFGSLQCVVDFRYGRGPAGALAGAGAKVGVARDQD
jgi:asparaginyl-tRNA synthetase